MAIQGIAIPKSTEEQEKAAKLAKVAQIGGTIVGGIYGGPAGAAAGGSIGGAVGGSLQANAANQPPAPQAQQSESAMQRRQQMIEQDPNRVLAEAEMAASELPPDVGAQVLQQLGLARQKIAGQV